MIKKILFSSLMTLGVIMTFGQTSMAKVQHLRGKEIYILSEPSTPHQYVGSVKTGAKLSSILTRGIYNEHLNDKMNQFMNRAIKKLSKKGIDFDALVYSDGKAISAIKFDEQSNQLATVQTINGIQVFVMSEPVTAYEVKSSVKNGINFIPFLTYGFANNSIERDVAQYVKKAKKEEVGAILYQTGRQASLIAFN